MSRTTSVHNCSVCDNYMYGPCGVPSDENSERFKESSVRYAANAPSQHQPLAVTFLEQKVTKAEDEVMAEEKVMVEGGVRVPQEGEKTAEAHLEACED
ncbi:MAG: hypothetical protein ACREBR_00140 [bacterium]